MSANPLRRRLCPSPQWLLRMGVTGCRPAERVSAVVSAETPWEINVGRADGIHVGMPVVDAAGLVGRVASVADERSVVMPVTDAQFVVAATADERELETSSAAVAVEGRGPGRPLLLRSVDPTAVSDFEVDDVVVTAGGPESLAPAGIPIGRISARLASDGTESQSELFEVTPYADLASVDSVTVLLYRPASAEPAPDTAAPAYVEGQPVDPADLIDTPSDYDAIIDEAIQVATRVCMEAQGFSYISNPASVPFVRPPTIRDADYRQQYGFGQPPQPAEPDRSEFTAQLDDPAWSTAWQGSDREGDGCSGEANATVFPPDGVPSGPARDTFTQALNSWRREIEATSLAQDANADWATCMTALGHSAATPSELANTMLAERPEAAAGPSPRELSAALDDWSCQLSTGYVDRVYGYLQQSTEQFATANASVIAATDAEYSTTLDRARQIIDGN